MGDPLSYHDNLLISNDFHNSSKLFEFHLFADDANLFYEHKSLQQLQENINSELINIHTWLCANKLSLNIEKSNFTLFHSPQNKLRDSYFNRKLCNKQLKREYCIKYLGILIDCHLNWKKTSWIYRSKNQEKHWHLMQVKTLCWFKYFGETLLCFIL